MDGAIASLPETYKSVVLLRDVEALSTEETAQILAISTDTVKTRLHRARLALRQKLDHYLATATGPAERTNQVMAGEPWHMIRNAAKRSSTLLSEYLDLELPPEACAEIESHMADCAPCIEFADSLKTTIALCRQHQPGVMPPAAERRREGEAASPPGSRLSPAGT